jgi:hypothetical protein
MEMALKFFYVPRGLSRSSPELNFLNSAHGHSCPEAHQRLESKEFNWPILGQMRFLSEKIWFHGPKMKHETKLGKKGGKSRTTTRNRPKSPEPRRGIVLDAPP